MFWRYRNVYLKCKEIAIVDNCVQEDIVSTCLLSNCTSDRFSYPSSQPGFHAQVERATTIQFAPLTTKKGTKAEEAYLKAADGVQ